MNKFRRVSLFNSSHSLFHIQKHNIVSRVKPLFLILFIIVALVVFANVYSSAVIITASDLHFNEGRENMCHQEKQLAYINQIMEVLAENEAEARRNLILLPDGRLVDMRGEAVRPVAGEQYIADAGIFNFCPRPHNEYFVGNSFAGRPGLKIYFEQPFQEDVNKDDGSVVPGRIAPTPDESIDDYRVARKITVPITAYSSEEIQTDSTPFITAFNTNVYWGVVAANFLPYGTKIRIPDYYGDKIFTVEDRMNERYAYRLDIWMRTKPEATNFGIRTTQVEILKKI